MVLHTVEKNIHKYKIGFEAKSSRFLMTKLWQ